MLTVLDETAPIAVVEKVPAKETKGKAVTIVDDKSSADVSCWNNNYYFEVLKKLAVISGFYI